MEKHDISINDSRCIGCGWCAKDCPTGNIEVREHQVVILSQDCIKCGHCVAVCPKAAVSIDGYQELPADQTEPVNLKAEDILQHLRFARSIRQFKSAPIASEVIAQIIEAGRLTPTAKNAQDVSYIILDAEKDRLEQMAVGFFRKLKPLANLFSAQARRTEIGEHFFFFGAPIAILVVAPRLVDGGLAAANMALVAEANGLGVLYSGFFTAAANHCGQLKRALNLPKGEKVVTTLVLGHAAVQYPRSTQKESANVRRL